MSNLVTIIGSTSVSQYANHLTGIYNFHKLFTEPAASFNQAMFSDSRLIPDGIELVNVLSRHHLPRFR